MEMSLLRCAYHVKRMDDESNKPIWKVCYVWEGTRNEVLGGGDDEVQHHDMVLLEEIDNKNKI